MEPEHHQTRANAIIRTGHYLALNGGDRRMLKRLFFYSSFAFFLTVFGFAHAETSDTAKVAFKNLDAYLQSNPLDFETSFDASSDGNELYRGKGHFIIRQPNALRADMSLEHATYLVISDGTVLTIYDPQQKKYAQASSPTSLSAAFSFFTGELGIDAQVINFMDVVHDAVSGNNSTTVKADGSETIGGKECDKFVVTSSSSTDTWQAWLEKGEKPLLCRLIYHNVDGPAQTNTFNWSASPQLPPDTFTFSPPAGSTKVDIGDLNMVSP
jgi:hypothetical protein